MTRATSTGRTILITGALGEMGHGITKLLTSANKPSFSSASSLSGGDLSEGDTLVLLDRSTPLSTDSHLPKSGARVLRITGDITDRAALEVLFGQHDFTDIIHLAAVLSTGGERDPLMAHRVNVDGSLSLLELARQQSARRSANGGSKTKFIFPSSIAVYGVPSLEAKLSSAPAREEDFLFPITMYGMNKLYVEHLGRYYSTHFGSLAREALGGSSNLLDFRSIRFPGLLSADTVPTGGTSDYGPEMLHAAAQGKRYACFVRPETSLPFMAMPDAVYCILRLLSAPEEALTRRAYNVSSFSITAAQIHSRAEAAFPGTKIEFATDSVRQSIVDSWPADMDDRAARADWGWAPSLSVEETFSSYLIPSIKARYTSSPRMAPNPGVACGA